MHGARALVRRSTFRTPDSCCALHMIECFRFRPMENILLASSDRVGNLGGEGGFLPLLPSRGNFVETGFSKSLSNHVRIDGSWYRRRFENFADDSLLLNTGVSFPISFSEATIRGTEAKIEVRSLGPFSGEVSYNEHDWNRKIAGRRRIVPG